jgi:chromosome segregation ATPase
VLIEYAMYFALGFLFAGLLMLLAMPAFWRRAMRLSMRRLQLLAPLSREDAIAERDLLRAEFAVKERRLEQRMDAVRTDKASVMLEVGRGAARIADLQGELHASRAYGRDLERRLGETQATLAERTALLGATEQALREATDAAHADAARQRELRSLHEERIGDLHQLNADLRREYAQLGEEFAHLSDEAERLAGVEDALARTSSELEQLKAVNLELGESFASLRSSSAMERESFIAEITHLENALRQARAEARTNADKLEALRADHAMLQGVATALRRDQAERRGQSAGGPDAPADARELAALRREIAELGANLVGERTEKLRNAASA